MILNQNVQKLAIARFRFWTPKRTGHLRYNAVKLTHVVLYDKFNIWVDGKVAHYGHILEVSEKIKYYYGKGSRAMDKKDRPSKERINKHYGWITQRAVPNTVEIIAQAIGGRVVR